MPMSTLPFSTLAQNDPGGDASEHARQSARAAAFALKETLWEDVTADHLERRDEALRLAKASGDDTLYAEILLFGIVPLWRANRGSESAAALEEAKVVYERLQDEAGLITLELFDGFRHYVQGDLVRFLRCLRESLPKLAHHPDRRHEVRALDWLAFTLIDVGLSEAAMEILEQQLVIAKSCQPRYERAIRRAHVLALEARFVRLRQQHGRYKLPADHPEVESLLRGFEGVRDLYARAPDGVDKFLAFGDYVQCLIHTGQYARAQSAWMDQANAKTNTHVFSPAFTWAREAELAVFCNGDYAGTIELVPWQLTKLTGADKAAELDLRAVLAEAYYRSGDYQSACEAQKQFYERAMHLANNNAQTLAAMLGMELKAERDKLQAQQALVHAGKLVAVGQLASSLAHEINQPAASLLLLARQLRDDLQAQRQDELADGIDDVQRHTERLSQLVIRLKNFARDEPVQLQLLNLSQVLQHAHSLVAPRLKAQQVQYKAEVPAGLYIRADQERLCLVLVNLINNALDAMKDQSAPLPAVWLTAWADADKGEVHLQVHDNGPGLSEAAEARLFEPFYTTKPAGEGLGLGLTIAREALDSIQARIFACNASTTVRGAVVTVVLVGGTSMAWKGTVAIPERLRGREPNGDVSSTC